MRSPALPVDERDCLPRRVSHDSEIPSEFRRYARVHDVRDTIYCPPDQWGPRVTPATLIVARSHTLLIMRRLRDRLEHTVIDYPGITSIESGRILLYSWLVIEWTTNTGFTNRTSIEFNTVASELMLGLLQKIRRRAFGSATSEGNVGYEQGPGPEVPRRLRIAWKEVAFPEQPALTMAYYPANPEKPVGHLVALTDREVVDIRELSNAVWQRRSYGVHWRFVPVTS